MTLSAPFITTVAVGMHFAACLSCDRRGRSFFSNIQPRRDTSGKKVDRLIFASWQARFDWFLKLSSAMNLARGRVFIVLYPECTKHFVLTSHKEESTTSGAGPLLCFDVVRCRVKRTKRLLSCEKKSAWLRLADA